MSTNFTLDELKRYHNEAIQFFGSELMLLNQVIPKITDDRLGKASVLLASCAQTGAALIQLAGQADTFNNETVMLARAFMEKITNFCYVGICNDQEYRAFILHPIYKHYHSIATPRMEDSFKAATEEEETRKERQTEFGKLSIVQEALVVFSKTKSTMNWTKKTLNQRIDAIREWGKLLDTFFTINKIRYYADASEALHGSLYGCSYDIGVFDPDFDSLNREEVLKKVYKDSACVLLHLGMLIHESFTLISYSNDIKKKWEYSYDNRGIALNLLSHILEIKLEEK